MILLQDQSHEISGESQSKSERDRIMMVKVGCDIVNIKRFEKSVENGGEKFLDRIFSSYELDRSSKAETLAGIFAAKEAVIKALGINAGKWHEIEVRHQKNGKPTLNLKRFAKEKDYIHDLSIAHDGGYAMALVCFIKKD
ncbi:holo-ACP synthase [Patescibacteria group bacterium]|nr:holo-ACP synthase [Patescibacteria group bacterium]